VNGLTGWINLVTSHIVRLWIAWIFLFAWLLVLTALVGSRKQAKAEQQQGKGQGKGMPLPSRVALELRGDEARHAQAGTERWGERE